MFLISSCHANILWPEMFITDHISANFLLLVAASILIEWPFVKYVTKYRYFHSFVAVCIANFLSMTVGLFLLGLLGLFWQVIIMVTSYILGIEFGTFSIPGWISSAVFFGLLNATLELFALAFVFQFQVFNRSQGTVSFCTKNFFAMFMANFLTAIITLVHMHYYFDPKGW